MPIYKVGNVKKDGLQKYHVRINYLDGFGKAKQLTHIAYGPDAAKQLERELQHELRDKNAPQAKRMTLQKLFDEYF